MRVKIIHIDQNMTVREFVQKYYTQDNDIARQIGEIIDADERTYKYGANHCDLIMCALLGRYDNPIYMQYRHSVTPIIENVGARILANTSEQERAEYFMAAINNSTLQDSTLAQAKIRLLDEQEFVKFGDKINNFHYQAWEKIFVRHGYTLNQDMPAASPEFTIEDIFGEIPEEEIVQPEKPLFPEKTVIEQMIQQEIDNHNKAIILTGAPGTGKTFSARLFADRAVQAYPETEINFIEKVQFHASYDYTDFIEGLKPAVIGYDKNTPITAFVRIDGKFKEFCRRAAEFNQHYTGEECRNFYFIVDEINRADLSRVFGELMYALEQRGEKGRIQTQYQNLPVYRINAENGMAELIPDDIFRDGFYIPENVILISTMNDIDRSVESIDFALRRRFSWIEINVTEELLAQTFLSMPEITLTSAETDILVRRILRMNQVIANAQNLGLNKQYAIGPAYFKNYCDFSQDAAFFDRKLAPFLCEYVRGRKEDRIAEFIQKCKGEFTYNEYQNAVSSERLYPAQQEQFGKVDITDIF